jgi:hypothetical protein
MLPRPFVEIDDGNTCLPLIPNDAGNLVCDGLGYKDGPEYIQ